jgi:hypothetical protein
VPVATQEPHRIFSVDESKLGALYGAYERERKHRGLGAALYHVSPQQRIDVLTVIEGLNRGNGWKRIGGEGRRELWLRYLQPVLAETRESAAALRLALDEVPGFFEPNIEDVAFPRKPPTVPPKSHGRTLPPDSPASRWLPWVIAVSLLVLLIGGFWLYRLSNGTGPTKGTTHTADSDGIGNVESSTADLPVSETPAFAEAYQRATDATLAALDQEKDSLTPRELASYYAGAMAPMKEPSTILSAMLRRWPLPVDQPIAQSKAGALALKHYILVAADLATGRSVESAAQQWQAALPEPKLLARLEQFAQPNAPPAPSEAYSSPHWPSWLPLLAFVPLLLLTVWVLAGLPRAVRLSFRRARSHERGYLMGVSAPVVEPPLPGLREQVRRLMRRESQPGRILDAVRSIKVTLANAGYVTPVMRPFSRAVEYVFLVQRIQHGDHELVRLRRIIETLKAGGLPVTVYEYDFDLNAVCPTSVRGAPHVRQSIRVDLRTLHEIHPNARLVVATKGRELADYFTRRPLPIVKEALSLWPQRVLLTPVPMDDWGECEMNLAEGLDTPLARSTSDGLFDLARGFDARGSNAPHRAAAKALGEGPLIERIVIWLERLRSSHGPDSVRGRPDILRFEDPALTSEAVPNEEFRIACVRALRRWLGPHGYFWLAACALYPDLRSDITFYFGMTLTRYAHPANAPVFDDTLFAQLSALPWFRLGRMPNWLREAVFSSLGADEKAMAQDKMSALIDGRVPTDQQATEQRSLPIWWPDPLGLEAPRSAIMVQSGPEETASDLSLLSRARAAAQGTIEGVLARGGWLVAGAFYCAGAWVFWPKSEDTPHALGAWWPLIAYVSFTALVAGAVALVSVLRRVRRPARVAAQVVAGVG